MASRRLRVRATHDEHPPAVAEHVRVGEPLRLALRPGAGVEGEVRDARTANVPKGVVVTVELDGFERRATLDARGRFRLLGCAPGRANLRVTAPGYVPLVQAIDLPAGEWSREITARDLRLQLQPGGLVSGLVRDERGLPKAGVEVSAGEARVSTDATGHFRLGPLAAGPIDLRAGSATARVFIDPGREATIELSLR